MSRFENPGEWQRRAACRGATQAMEMPKLRGPGASQPNARHVRQARLICAACPVLEPCREWALAYPDPAENMIAGGLTPPERDRVRKGRHWYDRNRPA